MRRGRLALAAAGLLAAVAAAAAGAASTPPAVQAEAYLVRGAIDGAVLAEREASQRRAVASITKLMTVLVTLEHAALDEVVTVAPAATGIGESSVFLRPGEQLTVRELVEATLLPSANDAATALALYVGRGSLPRFVALMNGKARALGMSDTSYRQPHGLDVPGHLSSARDAVTLLRAALAVPFVRQTVQRTTASIGGGRTLVSTDDLLTLYGPHVGGKTGHTSNAGWSEVAEARRGNASVQAVVLGSPSREQRNADLEALERWALAQYAPVRAVSERRTYALAALPYGIPAVTAVAPRTMVRTIRTGRPLVERVVAAASVALPVTRGQRIGEVRVFSAGRLIASSPLVAGRSVAEPGATGKIRWYATRTAERLWGLVT